MSSPESGPLPPSAYPPPKRGLPIGLIILGVAGLLGLLAVLGGIHVYRAAAKGSADVIAVGNHFIDAVGHHNYQAAHSLFTAPIQAKISADEVKDIETLVEKHHGAYLDHGTPQWFIQTMNGQTSVRLSYPGKFTKSISTISLVLVQTDKGYQVSDAHYEF